MARTILVADDNSAIRKMLCQMFEVEEDYDICAEAANGQEAFDLARKHHPDLIILDLSKPVMNGLEAARKLKEIMPEARIILFTQHAYLAHALQFGANRPFDRIVSKSDPKELVGHVRKLAAL